jgi:uncharacterized protein YndB with AHSA1/START domain
MKIYRRVRTDMDIANFKPAIVYTIYIASTPETVWQALTSAEFSRKYFFGNAVEVDLRVGGAYIVRTPDGALHGRRWWKSSDPRSSPTRSSRPGTP